MHTHSVSEVKRLHGLIEGIIQQAPPPPLASDFYTHSYPIFSRSFARVLPGEWTADVVIEKLSMVYAWMPKCIHDYNPAAIAALADALNQQVEIGVLMRLAAQCVNNSFVGGSKFLHFYAPERIVMCDSNMVALLWPGRNPTPSLGTALARYMHLLEAIESVSPDLKEKAMRWALARFGYPTAAMRAIEALLFHVARTGITTKAPPYSG